VAQLENDAGDTTRLWGFHSIGRAPASALRLNEAGVSWRHASLSWTGCSWELQDLGSRNGTFFNNRRIDPGVRVALRLGVQLRFGDYPDAWTVVDIGAPEPAATCLEDCTSVIPADGLIVLPDPATAEVSLFRGSDGEWIAETVHRVWQPARDEIIVAGGRRFRFEPGSAVRASSLAAQVLPTPRCIALELVRSARNQEVAVNIVHDGQRLALKPRAHSNLLWTLARKRIEDSQLPAASRGFIDQAQLLRTLDTSLAQLCLDIYRARRQFAEVGVVDAAQLIERRACSHELRIGVSQLSVLAR
jgi:hypothetical protein